MSSASYTHGHAGGPCSPLINILIVSNADNIEDNHIRCLAMRDGEDLDKLVENYGTNVNTKALIIVNTRDDLCVKGHVLPKESALPLYVLKNSNGKELMSILDGRRDIYAKVVVDDPCIITSTAAGSLTQQKSYDDSKRRGR